jgi:major intracellular serine protease
LIGKVLNRHGSGNYHGITDAIKWATNWKGKNGERCRIINMSLGGSHNDPKLERAILDACAKGIVVVCASGNEGDGNDETFEHGYPAMINETITVGACDEKGKMAHFTNNILKWMSQVQGWMFFPHIQWENMQIVRHINGIPTCCRCIGIAYQVR